MNVKATRIVTCLAAVVLLHAPAVASFHFARIAEIFTGTAAEPGAQYVVIVPYSNFQNQFSTVVVDVYDAAGNALPAFATFAANLPDTVTNQKSILVATAAAESLFGMTADQVATGSLPASGVICFRKNVTIPDCVSYGNYTGDPLVGGSPTGSPAPSIPSGAALRRDFGADSTLAAADDTDDSAADFDVSAAIPENYAGIRLEDLRADGDVTLSWTSTSPTHSIFKSSDPATVRSSLAVDTTTATMWTDPDPGLFPVLTCYVVKPN